MQHDPTSLTCLMEERKWGQVSPMKMGSWCHVFLDKFGYTFPTKASISQWTCIFTNNFVWNQIISSTFPICILIPQCPIQVAL
jgi:hypothetical protein